MSNTATTVPGKRDSFEVNKPEGANRLFRRQRKILRRLTTAEETSDSENAEIIVEREREDFHKEYGRGRGFSYVFTANDGQKDWTNSKPVKEEEVVIDDEDKLKKERKFAPTTLVKTWTRPTRSVSERVRDPSNKKKQKEDYRKFMNLGPRKPKNQKGDKTNIVQTALMASNENAGKIAEERRQLLELERVSRKRIKQLEAEVSELQQSFESANRENQLLRAKLNSEDQIVIEPYQRIYEDRQILRDSESGYKSIITGLESQLRDLQKAHVKVQKELSSYKDKYPTAAQILEAKAYASKSYWDGRAFKDENSRLRKVNEQLTKENDELKKLLLETNPYVHRQRPNKSLPSKQETLNVRYSYDADLTMSQKAVYNKSVHTGILKKQNKDDSYSMRKDFVNMLPDYFPDKGGQKLPIY